MLLVDVNSVTVAYGTDVVLDDVSIRLGEGERIGLIGKNGEGKTTLFETINGNIRPEAGTVILPSYIKTAYLKQQQEHPASRSLYEDMINIFSDQLDCRERIKLIEFKMEQNVGDEKLLKEYGKLLEKYEVAEGDSIEDKVNNTLKGVGFSEYDFEKPMSKLSGGQRNRAALAKILLSKANLLLLDEPTNHLDLEGIEYLENYLKFFPGGAIVVSHDRAFLDNVATGICEIERHKFVHYPGKNYTSYLPLKEKNIQLQLKKYEKQQGEIERQKEFIRRNIVGQKTKLAQSRRRMLQKMKLIGKPLSNNSVMHPVISDIKRSGLNVMKVENVSKSYSGISVLNDNNLTIERGEATGIIGPNACGKSTLLKIISGLIEADIGQVEIGSNVSIGYFGQHRDDVNYSRTILDQVWDIVPDWDEVNVRSYLGRFLFSGDEPKRIVSSLSGGETARLALAMLFLKQHNFLVLDEPTNHLDIASREVLEETLSQFTGTLLLVSHDRYFLNAIVDKIYAFENGGLKQYVGNYDYYLQKREENRTSSVPSEAVEKKTANGKSRQSYLKGKVRSRIIQKLKKIEREIEKTENNINGHREELKSEELASQWEILEEIQNKIDKLEVQLETLLENWEEVQNQL
ncbi:MAG: ABC-F family ATP-binding cassette domain-containing protein [candidate division Zixibacteria bacterium]|nr:ABC-F family ATP-binding cassette domain-containing protein [candidate division Zixibacteria bacterium]